VQTGQQVLVVEDLVSTGKSSLQVVDVLRSAGLEVLGMVSLFNYGFPEAEAAFAERSVPYVSLTDYPCLIGLAREKGLVTEEQVRILMEWRRNPATWTGA